MDRKKLKDLKKVVLSCAPVTNIDFEKVTDSLTSWDDQVQLFNDIFMDERLKKYPIRTSYQINFLQHFITALLHRTDEVYDEIYDYFCNLKVENNKSNFTYRHFIFNEEDQSVVIKEAQSIISNGTTGLSCTWSAAFKLVDWAAENKNFLKGKDVVELGSGTGFAGLLISKICQLNSLLLTDYHPKVMEVLKENCELNNKEVGVQELFWGDSDDHRKILHALKLPPDYIIASDIVFDVSLFEPLLATVKYFFSLHEDCVFIISVTVRNEDTFNKFLEALQAHSELETCELELPTTSIFPHFNKVEDIIRMYKINLKK